MPAKKSPKKPAKKSKNPVGRPTKYDPKKHPKECVEMGRKGMFKVQMAKAWDVDTDTITEWVNTHPIFSAAYKRAQNYRAAWMLEQGQEGLFGSKDKQFNAIAWSMIMRYDGQNTDERTCKLPELLSCNTFSEKAACIMNAFASGKLTPKEANTLADLVSKSAKIDEVTELRDKLEAIEQSVSGRRK